MFLTRPPSPYHRSVSWSGSKAKTYDPNPKRQWHYSQSCSLYHGEACRRPLPHSLSGAPLPGWTPSRTLLKPLPRPSSRSMRGDVQCKDLSLCGPIAPGARDLFWEAFRGER
jgi:hypothetical protein